MSTTLDAHLGFWRDYNRPIISRYQVLATDFWSSFMLGVIVASLTITNPYAFKILHNFLIWLFRRLGWLAAAWKSTDSSEPPSEQPGVTTSLLRPSSVDGQRSNHDEDEQLHSPVEESGHPSADENTQVDEERTSNVSASNEQDSRVPGLQFGSTINSAPGNMKRSNYGTENLSDVPGESRDNREVAWNLTRCVLGHLKKQTESPAIVLVVIFTIFFGIFVAQLVAAMFSAKMASDRAALVSSQRCGIWQFDDKAGQEAADRDDLHNYQKESRASQYARTCYNAPHPDDPFSCRTFYNQSIKFSTKTDQLCPFASSELCSGGLYSAVAFDTGLIDASVIGINAAETHKFRRTTICSPLNMSEPYIVSSESMNNTDYHYYYGTKDDIEYTFNTSGHPFDWLVPVYSVNTYFSSLYPESDYWHPIAGLRQPVDSTLTIIFVSSTHIYHTQRSFDPIFYADEPHYFEGFRAPFYYNSDPRARVLACVDKSEVCSPDGNTCWSMTAPVSEKVSSSAAYWLMKWSLEDSNIYDSVKWRLGTALLAQESVSQFVSLPLPSDQWQLEASQLFATSLARIQYDALGIATGEDRQRPGYVEVTPDEAKGTLCGIYKFKSPDHTNINLIAFIGLNILAIAIIILSLNASTIGLLPKSQVNEKASTRTLVIGFIVNQIVDLILFLIASIWTFIKFVGRKSSFLVKQIIDLNSFIIPVIWTVIESFVTGIWTSIKFVGRRSKECYKDRKARHGVDIGRAGPRN